MAQLIDPADEVVLRTPLVELVGVAHHHLGVRLALPEAALIWQFGSGLGAIVGHAELRGGVVGRGR